MRIECAGAIVFDGQGRLLLIQRGHEPAKGQWSLPGGRIEAGESAADAAVREVCEETGLDVRVVRLAGELDLPVQLPAQTLATEDADRQVGGRRPSDDTLWIHDFVAELLDPTQIASARDDAADVRWVTLRELLSLETTDGLLGCLADWGVMPTAP